MTDAETGSAHRGGLEPPRPSIRDVAQRELRAWADQCRCEEGDSSELWPEREARVLVEAIVACAYGEDPSAVERPARVWARTNPSLAVFARRLGVLRASFGATVALGHQTRHARLDPILEAVARAATAEWLATLGLAHAPVYHEAGLQDNGVERSARAAFARILEGRHRLREAGVAVLGGVAAGAAVLALVSSAPAPRGHVQAQRASQPPPAVQPPAGGRKARAVSLALTRRPGPEGATVGRSARTLTAPAAGPTRAGSTTPPAAGSPSAGPLPGGPSGLQPPVPLPAPVPGVPVPPAVPVSITGVSPVAGPSASLSLPSTR